MKFKLSGTVYTASSIEDLSLKMILQLEMETKEFGRPLLLGQIQGMVEELDKLKTDKERANHESAAWVLAVVVWATRRLAGETITFDEAVDFPMSDLVFLKQPQDRPNPTKARTRSGSGPARKRAQPRLAPKTSESPSISG